MSELMSTEKGNCKTGNLILASNIFFSKALTMMGYFAVKKMAAITMAMLWKNTHA